MKMCFVCSMCFCVWSNSFCRVSCSLYAVLSCIRSGVMPDCADFSAQHGRYADDSCVKEASQFAKKNRTTPNKNRQCLKKGKPLYSGVHKKNTGMSGGVSQRDKYPGRAHNHCQHRKGRQNLSRLFPAGFWNYCRQQSLSRGMRPRLPASLRIRV